MNRSLLSVDEETRLGASTWREDIGAEFVERWTIEREVRKQRNNEPLLPQVPYLNLLHRSQCRDSTTRWDICIWPRIRVEQPDQILTNSPTAVQIPQQPQANFRSLTRSQVLNLLV